MNRTEMARELFTAFLACIALVNAIPSYGPKSPIRDYNVSVCNEEEIEFIADKQNVCWYWHCADSKHDNSVSLIPRRCALGSRMDESYRTGLENPCTLKFDADIEYDCTRVLAIEDESGTVAGEAPLCYQELVCYNGGTNRWEISFCWCDCPDEWTGSHDCSKKSSNLIDSGVNATCFDYPKACEGDSYCLNGGTCQLQCNGDKTCICPTPYTNGKRCESFSCEPSPCMHGGLCNRGEEDKDEVALCVCPLGYSGQLCEVEEEVGSGEEP